jgi:hypothetical protein
MGRVEGVQVAGEAAHLAEPELDGDRVDPFRQPGPGHRKLDGDRRGPGGIQVGDELRQLTPLPPELEAERAAHPQVVIQVIRERAHDAAPVGQDRAIVRSRSTSTRAYAAVLPGEWCRST